MHAGTVPIDILAQRLAMPVDIDAVSFAQAHHDVARHPHLVGGGAGTFAENLEFPLALRHFSVDAFDVDAGVEAQINVLLGQFTSDAADVLVTNASVIFALRIGITAAVRETERNMPSFVEEIFLLETKPRAGIIQNRCATIARMRRLHVRHHNFAHHQRAVLAGGIRINRNGLQHAIRAFAFGLAGRAAIKAPPGQVLRASETWNIRRSWFCCGGSGRAHSRPARCILICILPLLLIRG